MNFLLNLISKNSLFTGIEHMEDELHAREDTLHATDESPVRFEIIKEGMKRGRGGPPQQLIPIMIPTLFGIRKTLRSVKDNPTAPKRLADAGLFSEIETRALALGANSVGYTKVPARWVFQNKAILYDNAIILSMEMDKAGIDTAPSIACQKTVFETYRDLGRITNEIAVLLRKRGYGAHAGHPLNGQALYPPLAQMAGLGWIGLNGIIITPEHGPRVRLAAVYTSIENLPFSEQNEHSWVAEFCHNCQVCIKDCPPKALYGKPIDHGNGQITYVDNNLCLPYFMDYYGCSVCIKVCPFNKVPYETLLNKFNNRHTIGVTQDISS
ncbi:4Fe-4S dicluster domain-containing protein [Chloroflexota bacterium]